MKRRSSSASVVREEPAQTAMRPYLCQFVCSWRGGIEEYFPFHEHSAVEIVYHPRGRDLTTLGDGKCIEFDTHGIVIYPARLRHDQRMTSPGVDVCLHITTPETEDGKPTPTEALYIPPLQTGGRSMDRYIRTEFLHLAQSRGEPSRQMELDLRVTALFHRLLQMRRSIAWEPPQGSAEAYVRQAQRFICDSFAEIDSVHDVASHVGISSDYLRHIFAAYAGTSVNRFLNQVRIGRAQELLTHSQLPIKKIAALVGFETERYLSTKFRRLTGTSPGEFRRRNSF